MMDNPAQKQLLRQRVLEQLRVLTPQQRLHSDQLLFENFLSLPQVAAAQRIFAFLGIGPRESETRPLLDALIDRGKVVCLPRMLPGRGMETPQYHPDTPLVTVGMGLQEPGQSAPLIPKGDIDLVLVPSVCYDARGYRLGFGGGYYDRWLADFSRVKVGLCRSCVLQNALPVEGHDIPVDYVLTEEERLSCLHQAQKRGDAPLVPAP